MSPSSRRASPATPIACSTRHPSRTSQALESELLGPAQAPGRSRGDRAHRHGARRGQGGRRRRRSSDERAVLADEASVTTQERDRSKAAHEAQRDELARDRAAVVRRRSRTSCAICTRSGAPLNGGVGAPLRRARVMGCNMSLTESDLADPCARRRRRRAVLPGLRRASSCAPRNRASESGAGSRAVGLLLEWVGKTVASVRSADAEERPGSAEQGGG